VVKESPSFWEEKSIQSIGAGVQTSGNTGIVIGDAKRGGEAGNGPGWGPENTGVGTSSPNGGGKSR